MKGFCSVEGWMKSWNLLVWFCCLSVEKLLVLLMLMVT